MALKSNQRKLKDLNHFSLYCIQPNSNNPQYDVNKKIQKQKRSKKDSQLSLNLPSPSKRMVDYLLNNIRLSASSLEKFLRISAEHIPALNLTEEYITS